MKFILAILALALVMGIATAIDPVDISGKDFADFNVMNGSESRILTDNSMAGITDTMLSFLSSDDDKDGAPFGDKQPLLIGSLAKGDMVPVDLPSPAEQVEIYLRGKQ